MPDDLTECVPDFFIIGAPKCGTSSLHHYLSRHPDTYMPSIKEPLFFCGDKLSVVRDFRSYLELFRNPQRHHLRGEASALYLYYEDAVPAILRLNPKAKFFVSVRNPIDMALSYHNQAHYSFEEPEASFEEAWRLSGDPDRAIGPNCKDPRLLDYKSVCRLGAQVARLKTILDERQLHVIVFDDLCDDAAAVYNKAVRFLCLPVDQQPVFPIVNERMEHRFSFLGKMIFAPPPMLKQIKDDLKWRSPVVSKKIARGILRFNTRPRMKPTLNARLRAEMVEEFKADIELLSEILKRDLRPWLRGESCTVA